MENQMWEKLHNVETFADLGRLIIAHDETWLAANDDPFTAFDDAGGDVAGFSNELGRVAAESGVSTYGDTGAAKLSRALDKYITALQNAHNAKVDIQAVLAEEFDVHES